ncbi:MAG: hypothetical protein IBV52_08655 [Candidatus Bathyarchaeota archaeon]
MSKEKRSPELDTIAYAIRTWMKKHKDKVIFHGSFVAFNGDFKVTEDMLIGYGAKEKIKISMEKLQALLAKEEGNFINWSKAYIKPFKQVPE